MKTITKNKKLNSKKKRTIKLKKLYKSKKTNDIFDIKPRLTIKNVLKLKELTQTARAKSHDLLFLDANNYILKDNNIKDASDIYLYLMKNNYNKENIAKWLLYNSPEYSIITYVFNKLLRDGKITDEDKLKVYVDMLNNKSKYNFNMNKYENVINEVNELMHNENLCNKIDLFQIIYYSDFSSHPNWLNHIKYYCNAFKSYDTVYQPTLGNINTEKLDNLGIYILYNQSPAFNHSIEVISFLSEFVPIILYVEGTQIDTKHDKYIKDRQNLKIELIGGKSDDEVSNLMKSNNHIFLIFIYGFYIRSNVVLEHPAKYTFHYLEVQHIYTKKLFDFNIIDKYYNMYLSEYQDIENDFGLVKLDVPINMTPVCNICEISRPIYNPEQIRIGLILNECKLCNKTINIINKILAKNNKIYLTIYGFCDKIWLFSNFNKKYHSRIELKSYEQNNYMNELQNNLLYIDTFLYSGHSTAMEILKSNRPFIAFKNKTKFFGLVSSNIIRHIDMCDELCSNTEDEYVELVLHHLQNETYYTVLYYKFIYQLQKSNILDNSKYAEELYNKLNELYKIQLKDECLQDMKKILDDNNQHFFLVCGTLLGQYRDNNFISYDSDIDIGILYEKYNDNIKDYIINSGLFTLLNILGKNENSLELKFIHKNGTNIDIFLFYHVNKQINDSYYYCASFFGICNSKPDGFCKWGNHIPGFIEIKFKNKKYNIPQNTDDFLTECYGDWKIPKQFNYYQGLEDGYKNLIN